MPNTDCIVESLLGRRRRATRESHSPGERCSGVNSACVLHIRLLVYRSQHLAGPMPWTIKVRGTGRELQTLPSGEMLIPPAKPKIHRSPSSLERAFDIMSSEVLRASRTWHPWQALWYRRRNAGRDSDSEGDNNDDACEGEGDWCPCFSNSIMFWSMLALLCLAGILVSTILAPQHQMLAASMPFLVVACGLGTAWASGSHWMCLADGAQKRAHIDVCE